ncbi:MAG TPA: hypothetical protein DEV59_05245 [Proteus sp.]|nr:hypothetical protein [Proteus sp. (in: enterobacteria)]
MLTTKTSGETIITLTQSWRYLLFLSLLPYIGVFLFLTLAIISKFSLLVASLLFLFTQYHLFRLWLDSCFFRTLYRYRDGESFDEGLQLFFPARPKKITMKARWLGTKRLFTLSLIGILIQWGWFLLTLLF